MSIGKEDKIDKRLAYYGQFWTDEYYKKIDICKRNNHLIEDYFEKVIFLDIDGVLNDDGDRRNKEGIIIDPDFVANLARIVNETGAEIILSSSWRYGYIGYARSGFDGTDKSMDLLLKLFEDNSIRIAGITPCYFNGPDGRPFEVRSWLCHRPDVKNFVILDDETFWKWNWLEPHVVCTCREIEKVNKRSKYDLYDYIKGLDDEATEKAIKILKG